MHARVHMKYYEVQRDAQYFEKVVHACRQQRSDWPPIGDRHVQSYPAPSRAIHVLFVVLEAVDRTNAGTSTVRRLPPYGLTRNITIPIYAGTRGVGGEPWPGHYVYKV